MPASFDDPLGTLPAEQLLPPAARTPAGAEAENAFLKRLLDALPYPVTYIDADLVYRQCNAAAAATVGRTPGEIVGKAVASVVGADSEVVTLLRRVLESGEPYEGTLEFTPPGSARTSHYRVSYVPDMDGDGRTLGVLTNVVDVTERRAAEARVREHAQLLDTSTEAIFAWHLDGPIDYWNQGAERFYGYAPEEAVGKVSHELLATAFPDGFERFRAELERDGAWHGELSHTARDGHRVRVESRMQLMSVGGRRLVLEANRDIAERIAAQKALRESEQHLRLATEAAGIGTFDWDIRTGVNRWSKELEAMYGLSPGEFGRTQPGWEQLVHPDDRAAAVALVDETLESGLPVEGEWRVVWPDGSVHWLSGRFQAYKDAAGKPLHMTGVNIDVTERKVTEDALRASEERYRAIVELADEDLAASSDETYSSPESFATGHQQRRRFRTRFIALAATRRHRLRTLLAAIALELAFLIPLGLLPTSRQVLGLPGSLLMLIVVVTAALAGWQAGLAAAIAGGVIFWGTVAGFGAQSAPVTAALSMGIWVAAALVSGLLADALRDQTRKRKSAAVALARAEILREHEAERATQEERTRIARDLHDSVTQSLFAATLKTEALTIASGDEAPGIAAAAEDVRRLSRGSLAQMRTLLLELRGDPVEEVPLQQLLRNQVEAAESRASVKVTLTLNEGSPLPPKVHEAVYRITQEALNNVVRHAKAENAWVQIDADPSQARLLVGDDGRGFDPGASVDSSHIGLRSMRERADGSGGLLFLRSAADEGTTVKVDWSLDDGPR